MYEREASQGVNKRTSGDRNTVLDPGEHPRGGVHLWTALVILVVTGIVISLLIGLVGDKEFTQLRERVGLKQERQSVTLVEVDDDLILMAVGPPDNQEVRTMDVETHVVQDASRGARQVTQPRTSHSGEQVAYFTVRDGTIELDVSSLEGTSKTLISASEFASLADKKDLDDLAVCPWSQLSWSREGRYLAFFGCTDSASLVLVTEVVTGITSPLETTRAAGEHSRTLLWLSDTELALTQPEETYDTVWTVNVESREKAKVFGP